MNDASLPTLDEVALGAFLEDIGKFMQRAHAGNADLPQQVRSRASVVLPGFQGRSSHWHALWTDAFFEALEERGASLPGGLNLARVREAVVYHHNPQTPLHWLSAEADRLSAGMDRKPKDEEAEQLDAVGRDGFRRTPLRSFFSDIDLRLGKPKPAACSYRVAEFAPSALVPAAADGTAQKAAYAELWPRFFDAFVELCRWPYETRLFHEGVLSLSERFTWAVPSSTVDQPDVSLHDHNKSVAAIASCLYLYHQARAELGDQGAVKNRGPTKYRFLVGDLSGIQSTLFRLSSEGVSGAARILRARSFLMSAALEGAALLCLQALGLPPYCQLQAAGGRFLLLVPNLAGIEACVDRVRREVDEWLAHRYFGDLALNLALGPPVSAADLMRERFAATMQALGRTVEETKQRPLSTVATGVLRDASVGAEGRCRACGVRPASVPDPNDSDVKRCRACHDEHQVGRLLPRAKAIVWSSSRLPDNAIEGPYAVVRMSGGLWMTLLDGTIRPGDREAWSRIVSGTRLPGTAGDHPPAFRHSAHHVPLLDGREDRRFADLSEEARQSRPGDAMTFEHLAALSRETLDSDRVVGRPMLAALKADVDRLGQIFSRGLSENSLGRMAALSRMLDAFFVVVLPDLLRQRFPETYTVYAGGDDLLLLGPWREMLALAVEIESKFRAFVGGNENVTLSAGVELFGAAEPLNRAVLRADDRLDAAKDAGRNRCSAIDATPMDWAKMRMTIDRAEAINDLIRSGQVSTAFLYKALHFSREKVAAEAPRASLRAAGWRSRWAYHLGRAFDARSAEDRSRIQLFDGLLDSGLEAASPKIAASAEAALVIALYRNR